jgi:hypothetical protein
VRLFLIVASATWFLALGLRALATTYGQTLENTRHLPGPPLVWWLRALDPDASPVPALSRLAILLILGAIVLIWWRFRPTRLAVVGAGLLIGGGAANTAERIAVGGVTDYIPVPWAGGYLVNITDIAVLTGAALLTVAFVCSLVRRTGLHRRRVSS